MTAYTEQSREELLAVRDELQKRYSDFQARNLAMDMTRGKPSPEQLDLAMEMLSGEISSAYKAPSGVDCRNYGGLDGIKEAKTLFAEYLGVAADEIIIGDSASLKMMHDTIMGALVYGVAMLTLLMIVWIGRQPMLGFSWRAYAWVLLLGLLPQLLGHSSLNWAVQLGQQANCWATPA